MIAMIILLVEVQYLVDIAKNKNTHTKKKQEEHFLDYEDL